MKKYSPLICLLIFLQFPMHVYLWSCSVSYLQISAKDHRFPLATALSVKGINEGLSSLGQRREGTLFEILVYIQVSIQLHLFTVYFCFCTHPVCILWIEGSYIAVLVSVA